jgi:DNA repair protein RecN (Recombination protein N)
LNQGRFQLELLDAFASNQEEILKYRTEFQKLGALKKALEGFEKKEIDSRKELDYHKFLFTELEEAAIEDGELLRLQEESEKLENAEAIKSALATGAALLGSGETPVLIALAQVKQSISGLSKYDKAYVELSSRINSSYIELKDICAELENAGEALHVDNGRLDEVSAKLDKLGRLMKKHNVRTEKELIGVKEDLENKLLAFGSLESEIQRTRKEIESSGAACLKIDAVLSRKRKEAIPHIERETKTLLAELGMPNAAFRITQQSEKECGPTGTDTVNFLFSANKGVEAADVSRVASGGELSRLMLCLKSLLAEKKKLPTIIFDEIDTGVSGEVAAKIGRILHKMSSGLQVITITHLPQMASRGEHHLFVYKKDEAKRTTSLIKTLVGDERVQEIAKMLSAGKPGESALQNAKELLNA